MAGLSKRTFWLPSVAFLLTTANTAIGQSLDPLSSMVTDIDIRGDGWSQISNVEEVLEFCLGVVETVIMTALIAFHPRNRMRWYDRRDWEAPRTFFLYALIGMVVGFHRVIAR